MVDPQLLDEFRKIQISSSRASRLTIWGAIFTLVGVIFAAMVGSYATVQAVKAENQNATIQFTKSQQASAYTQFMSTALKLENELYDYASLFRPSDSTLANSSSPHFSQLREIHESFTTTYYNCKLFQPAEMDQSIENLSDPLEEAYQELMGAGIEGTMGQLTPQTIESINTKYNIDTKFSDSLTKLRDIMTKDANKQLWS